MFANVEGQKVKVGDWVCFKSDIEQCGKIVSIKQGYNGAVLVLEREDGFEGGYIGGQERTQVSARECWIE